jgi:hypothetical protein
MSDSEKLLKLVRIANGYPTVRENVMDALNFMKREARTIDASTDTDDTKLERAAWVTTQTYIRVVKVLIKAKVHIPPELLEAEEEVTRDS